MYSDQERLCYRPARDGVVIGQYDPLAVRRRLVIRTKGRFNDLLKQHASEDELEAAVAEEEIVAAARDAFSLPPLTSEGGFADADVLDLVDDYLAYLGNSKSAGVMEPTSPPPTAPCQSC